jgi:hypothetical protein
MSDLRTAAQQALEQSEQEPVARVLQTVGQYHTGRCVAEVETVRRLRNGESLYTHPPRREWQGLTEEEIEDCWDGYLSDYQLQMIRTIEDKLKERNA